MSKLIGCCGGGDGDLTEVKVVSNGDIVAVYIREDTCSVVLAGSRGGLTGDLAEVEAVGDGVGAFAGAAVHVSCDTAYVCSSAGVAVFNGDLTVVNAVFDKRCAVALLRVTEVTYNTACFGGGGELTVVDAVSYGCAVAVVLGF